MSRPADHDPRLLDLLAGELPPAEAEALEAELARDGDLGAARDAWAAVFAAEREAFEPAAERAALERDGLRVAAWVQDTVRRDEAAAAKRSAAAPRRRTWARILAFSVAAHVAVLAVLAIALHGGGSSEDAGTVARVGMGSEAFEVEDDLEARYANSMAAVQWRELVQDDLGAQLDDAALMEQERLPEEIARFDFDEPAGWGAPAHPAEVTVPMLRRKNAGLKRRRLDLLGFNAKGSLRAVGRGLHVLALRQNGESGLFEGAGGTTSVRTSSLATLAFLGEGHASQGSRTEDEVVARAVRGLRRTVASRKALAAVPDEALGPLGVALAEDYMLSYGSLTPHAAGRRTDEIERLTAEARTRLTSETTLAATDRTWLVWAVDAAQRAGVVGSEPHDRAAFQGWVASTAKAAAGDATDTQEALAVGMALLYAERGAEKPRFKRWSRTNAAKLLEGLKLTGEARRGDPVGETALVLLALQMTYRAY
ncbi:MAG: hypothetical protein P1V36_02260 [Planctomycetota bacterium]|nr:hypothetical protein [Planctomycetota bacterium]